MGCLGVVGKVFLGVLKCFSVAGTRCLMVFFFSSDGFFHHSPILGTSTRVLKDQQRVVKVWYVKLEVWYAMFDMNLVKRPGFAFSGDFWPFWALLKYLLETIFLFFRGWRPSKWPATESEDAYGGGLEPQIVLFFWCEGGTGQRGADQQRDRAISSDTIGNEKKAGWPGGLGVRCWKIHWKITAWRFHSPFRNDLSEALAIAHAPHWRCFCLGTFVPLSST